jgi:hypothetical protein
VTNVLIYICIHSIIHTYIYIHIYMHIKILLYTYNHIPGSNLIQSDPGISNNPDPDDPDFSVPKFRYVLCYSIHLYNSACIYTIVYMYDKYV